ncbi:alanine racemase [Aestuariibius sp. 2305UL40-4]|uniref:alanine racemase n=1 Tax=Aestuariibius violaceus TaxID=3234132 RepID=UPI00345E7432
MGTGLLTIDPAAIAENWRHLDAMTTCETGAVVKADAYGLGIDLAAPALASAGARTFFVAQAEEGAAVRQALGPGPEIYVFSGHMEADAGLIETLNLIPLLNSLEQVVRHLEALPTHPFGLQFDTGMNRLGIEPADWAAIRQIIPPEAARLAISHLACADEPDHPQNKAQLHTFLQMVEGVATRRSLAATGGILLGAEYHFDLTRPGIGLYGGAPYTDAQPVVQLDLPVIQIRDLTPGETVGYGAAWTAERPSVIATLSAGYADGLIRALSNGATLWHGETPCPLAGRVSMDLLTVDVTDLEEPPETLTIIGPHQGIDALAKAAGTIGYEILTSLGPRYRRETRRESLT